MKNCKHEWKEINTELFRTEGLKPKSPKPTHYCNKCGKLGRKIIKKSNIIIGKKPICYICGKPSIIKYGKHWVCSKHYQTEINKTFKQAIIKTRKDGIKQRYHIKRGTK